MPYITEDAGGISIVLPAHDCPAPAWAVEVPALPPTDFQAAWRLSNGVLSIDMEAARSIQRDRIRVRRAPLFDRLAVEVDKASDSGNAVRAASAVALRVALRDAPAHPIIAAAPDAASLLNAWPPVFANVEAWLASP